MSEYRIRQETVDIDRSTEFTADSSTFSANDEADLIDVERMPDPTTFEEFFVVTYVEEV